MSTATGKHVPLSQFGKDHWSTLLYIESRIVDADCTVDNDKMRCDFERHRHLAGPVQARGNLDGRKYPTTLADGSKLESHDDWDCVEDLVAVGAVVWGGTGIRPVFGLTDFGWGLVGQLRRHLGERPNRTRGYAGFIAKATGGQP